MPVPPSVVARYQVRTGTPDEALTALCRGQSVGNPRLFTDKETPAFLKKWCATGNYASLSGDLYEFEVRWPRHNFGQEGISYLLSVVLGGQCDIDLFDACRLMDLELSSYASTFPGPRYGIPGLRQRLGIPAGRPLIGGIVKPKIGMSPQELADVVKAMVQGGCDFIKEDEILANQPWCRMSDRLPLVKKALEGTSVLYAACVTADGAMAWIRARQALNLGANAVHLNQWCGLGTYLDVRSRIEAPIHFQKSGDRVLTEGPFSLHPRVLFQLVKLIGCDIAHVGMYGGYRAESSGDLAEKLRAMAPVLPSFSCGVSPENVGKIVQLFGTDVMLTSGGWIHSQPMGVEAAVRTLRKAVHDATG